MLGAFADKPIYTDPEGVDIPTMCLPDSDVAAIRSSSNHSADNVRSKLRRSPCMQAVRFCSPRYAGLNVDDQSPGSDALQSLCRGESIDVVFSASAKTLGIVQQGFAKAPKRRTPS